MADLNSFYLQLPSNGDPIYHPGNTLSEFSIHLPKRIELTGKWSVGLVELSYPHNFIQLSKSRTAKFRITKNPAGRLDFPLFNFRQRIKETDDDNGWMDTFKDFLNNYIKKKFKKKSSPVKIDINSDEGAKLFRVLLQPDCQVTIDSRLAFILGFNGDKSEILTKTTEAPGLPQHRFENMELTFHMDILCDSSSSYVHRFTIPEGYYSNGEQVINTINALIKDSPARDDVSFEYVPLTKSAKINIAEKTFINVNDAMGELIGIGHSEEISLSPDKSEWLTPPNPIDVDIGFKTLYIYSTLIASDEIVGASLAPLLRCVPVKGIEGENISEIYQFAYYKPLVRNSFHEIGISLRDDTGDLVSFSSVGRVNITLHFKRDD